MKKLTFTTLFFFVFAVSSMAQTWQKFNYQGVARNAMGEVIENQVIGVRISLHEGTAVGALVYQETHSATTNEFGLFNLEIGGGTVVSGNFGTIDWGNDDYYVEVEMDPVGGTAYADMGTTQLLSVPYALYAENAGVPGVPGPQGPVGPVGPTGPLVSGGANQTLRHNGSDWEAALNLYNNGTRVGAGDIGASNELDGVFTVRGANSSTDGIEGVFLDVINDEGNTAGTLAGIRFCNYPVTTTNDHIPGGIFWKSTGQTFGRGDLVFVTGTAGGSANVNTNDRMTISNDGYVGIAESTPISDLHINQSAGASTNQGTGGINLQENVSGNDHWRIYNSDPYIRFNYSNDNGGTYTPKAYVNSTDGSWNQLSDASVKRDINPLPAVLSSVMKLNAVEYYYIDNKPSDNRSIGFLAQEAAKLFPNTVSHEEGETLLGIDYSKFAVIAIKAIQEQQQLIEQLQVELEAMKTK
ncbi:MAG: hypothetical protein RL266_2024 [Bacteroidota bacterium]|jgi:hypothetical protein